MEVGRTFSSQGSAAFALRPCDRMTASDYSSTSTRPCMLHWEQNSESIAEMHPKQPSARQSEGSPARWLDAALSDLPLSRAPEQTKKALSLSKSAGQFQLSCEKECPNSIS